MWTGIVFREVLDDVLEHYYGILPFALPNDQYNAIYENNSIKSFIYFIYSDTNITTYIEIVNPKGLIIKISTLYIFFIF